MSKFKNMKYKPLDWLFHGIAHLPYSVLYLISDCLFVLIYHVAKYRVKVARKNIEEAFPDLSAKEHNKILRKFYRHLSDYFVETIKLLNVSDEEMKRRMKFENIELIDNCIKSGKSISVYLGHYANWEYITSVTLWSKSIAQDNVVFAQIYRKLRNEWFDKFFLKLRARFGSEGIEKKNTLRSLLKYKSEGKLSITGYMSDQHPSGDDVHHVVRFLNHDTAMITGTEVVSKRLGMDVLFFDITKERRGYYKAIIKKITTQSASEDRYAITDAYTSMLEENIKRQPELWLWTHKRWKHKCVCAPVALTALKENQKK